MSNTTILPIVGLTMTSVVKEGDHRLRFTTDTGRVFEMDHDQACCESVEIEDICGELDWLVGSPITQAEETSQDGDRGESSTWTFYRIATAKGLVVIRWLGMSNGFYSERVNFTEVQR